MESCGGKLGKCNFCPPGTVRLATPLVMVRYIPLPQGYRGAARLINVEYHNHDLHYSSNK